MSFTFQQVLDRARLPLNDEDKIRYPDAELLVYATDAYLMLRRYRPDMFLSSWTLSDISTFTVNTTFPRAPDEFMPAIADYVTARAEFKDDEHTVAERAQAFYELFAAQLRA